MTNGTSQGLFVIVAVVIFGIFVLIAYLLFGTTLKTNIGTIFEDGLVQSQRVFQESDDVIEPVKDNVSFSNSLDIGGIKLIFTDGRGSYYSPELFKNGNNLNTTVSIAHVQSLGMSAPVSDGYLQVNQIGTFNHKLAEGFDYPDNTYQIRNVSTTFTIDNRVSEVGGTELSSDWDTDWGRNRGLLLKVGEQSNISITFTNELGGTTTINTHVTIVE